MEDETSIRVVCPKWRINRLLRLEVFVDTARHGQLRPGRSVEVPVAPGTHEVKVRSTRFGFGSSLLTVPVSAGNPVEVLCRANFDGMVALAADTLSGDRSNPEAFQLSIVDGTTPLEGDEPGGPHLWALNMSLSRRAKNRTASFVNRHYIGLGIFQVIWPCLLLIGSLTDRHRPIFWSVFFGLGLVMSIAVLVMQLIGRRLVADLIRDSGSG